MSIQEVYIFCILPFLGASLLCSVMTVMVRSVARRWFFQEEDDSAGEHDGSQPPGGGGIALFMSIGLVVMAGVIVTFEFLSGSGGVIQESIGFHADKIQSHLLTLGYLFAGAAVVFTAGVLSDIRGRSPTVLLLGIAAASALVYTGGIRFNLFLEPEGMVNKLVRGIVTVGWVGVLTTSFGRMDSSDGQCVGASFFIALGLGVIGLRTGQIFPGTLAFIVGGSAFGFLVHNAPTSRFSAGKSGCLTLGFFLSTMAVSTTFFQQPVSTPIYLAPVLLFSVPLIDLSAAVWHAVRDGIPLSEVPSLSRRLVERGTSDRLALLFTMMWTGLTCLLALSLLRADVIGGVLVILGTVVMGVFWMVERPSKSSPGEEGF